MKTIKQLFDESYDCYNIFWMDGRCKPRTVQGSAIQTEEGTFF